MQCALKTRDRKYCFTRLLYASVCNLFFPKYHNIIYVKMSNFRSSCYVLIYYIKSPKTHKCVTVIWESEKNKGYKGHFNHKILILNNWPSRFWTIHMFQWLGPCHLTIQIYYKRVLVTGRMVWIPAWQLWMEGTLTCDLNSPSNNLNRPTSVIYSLYAYLYKLCSELMTYSG